MTFIKLKWWWQNAFPISKNLECQLLCGLSFYISDNINNTCIIYLSSVRQYKQRNKQINKQINKSIKLFPFLNWYNRLLNKYTIIDDGRLQSWICLWVHYIVKDMIIAFLLESQASIFNVDIPSLYSLQQRFKITFQNPRESDNIVYNCQHFLNSCSITSAVMF